MKGQFTALFMLLISAAVHAQRPAHGPISDKKYIPEEMGYKLVWNDEFEGTQLDTTKWKIRGVGPRAIAYVSPRAVKVEDGLLK